MQNCHVGDILVRAWVLNRADDEDGGAFIGGHTHEGPMEDLLKPLHYCFLKISVDSAGGRDLLKKGQRYGSVILN
jgi:hypothetical protein